MTKTGNTTGSPRVGAYALIGREDRLLVIAQPDRSVLPGGEVHADEPVEQALRRILRCQLGGTIADLDFCAVIEHDAAEPGGPRAFALAFLFDVTLTEPHFVGKSASHPVRWAHTRNLATLAPPTVRNDVISGLLSSDRPWRGWSP
ncbi:NUDIX domain-containing protein [Kibdelosporangium persicum]|uniref:NUDIX domain-containing protein n=1 Tax=Kibdelosporangium persicum TaxID=2698649 RepID=UPI0015672898|nr:NUDIX domain-containing protein [Kibdelosporangium persicum]